jgi:hypothetical protein
VVEAACWRVQPLDGVGDRDGDHRQFQHGAYSLDPREPGRVPGLFESAQPGDKRPRQAIDEARAWVRGEITMSQARTAAGHANAAAET